MSASFDHTPVLVDRVVALLAPVPEGVVVDATLGGGGHAEAILSALPHVSILGIDQDADALSAAVERLARFGGRVIVRHARFDAVGDVLDEVGVDQISGALFDLGVSSPQLDRPERGFSYRGDAPLDMRMDQTVGRTAADLVNELPERELAHILHAYGDERFARRIAKAIVGARPVTTTAELAELVRGAIPAPARRTGGHPAKRTFQALRIAVNDELAILPKAIDTAIDRLAPGGRCAVLAYHSGEDRIVKARFRHAATGGWTGPSHLPVPEHVQPTVRLLKQGSWTPAADEIAANQRSESARLRAIEKLAAPHVTAPGES
jgi:16S rRNA (cytosine1402-N4)-methyltransferase